MAKLEIKLTGVRELLRSDEVHDMLMEQGQEIMARLPSEDYEISDYCGAKRWNVGIRTTSKRAIRACLKHDELWKAVGGGGK